MATNEERLQDTIQSVQDEEYRSIRQAALSNGVASLKSLFHLNA